jgi:hypothetical protein
MLTGLGLLLGLAGLVFESTGKRIKRNRYKPIVTDTDYYDARAARRKDA